MPLQTTGAISLSDVQSEFGGSNPISMSEYYRGGANVPTTISTVGAWSAYYGNTSTYYWTDLGTLRWNNSTLTTSAAGTSTTIGGYEYQRGTFITSSGGGKGSVTISYYRVRRRTAGSSTTVNTSVPSSGTISMNQFYGGRKT